MENENDINPTAILKFEKSTRYWIIRASGGKYLNDFIDDEYIGIQYNSLTISDLISDNEAIKSVEYVKDKYIKKYDPDGILDRSRKQRLTEHSKQTYLFTFEMKIGDVVIVPGKHSNTFAIGVITGAPYDEDSMHITDRTENANQNGLNFAISNYVKRRPVFWIKTLKRTDIPADLSWSLNMHQTIMEITKSRKSLMPLIYPVYEYNNKIYCSIFTNKGGNFTVQDWALLTPAINTSFQGLSNSVEMQATIHSPGDFTVILQNVDFESLKLMIATLWGITKDQPIINYGMVSYPLIRLLIGKNGVKKGLVDWYLDEWNKYEDIRQKSCNNKQLRKNSKVNESIADKLQLSVKDRGTAISGKRNRTDKGEASNMNHNEK